MRTMWTAAAVAIAAAWCTAAGAEAVVLHAAPWHQAQASSSWATLPPLVRVAEAFDAEPGTRIVVRYPGGDAGNAWARAVRDRLVAMGIASRHIELQPGSGYADALVLEAEAPR
jgi:hypothetical protein